MSGNFLGTTVRSVFRHFRPSMLSFVLMRVTGLALVAYLFLHIWTIGAVRRVAAGQTSAEAFDRSVNAYDTTFGHVIEYLLLACLLAHAANGLRLLVADWWGLTRRQQIYLWGAAAAVLAVLGAVLPVFFPGIFGSVR